MEELEEMEEINYDDFWDKTSLEEKQKRIEDLFEFKCKKCGSSKVIIEGYDDIHSGGRYTGVWGDAGIIVKCKNCGNAINLIAKHN